MLHNHEFIPIYSYHKTWKMIRNVKLSLHSSWGYVHWSATVELFVIHHAMVRFCLYINI